MSDLIDPEELSQYKTAFHKFDKDNTDTIPVKDLSFVFTQLSLTFNASEIRNMQKEADDGSGNIPFDEFCMLIAKYVLGSDENMEQELRDAFRLYDKDNQGFIPCACLREILRGCDETITDQELDGIITEIDQDGSGTVDFEEFMEVFNG